MTTTDAYRAALAELYLNAVRTGNETQRRQLTQQIEAEFGLGGLIEVKCAALELSRASSN